MASLKWLYFVKLNSCVREEVRMTLEIWLVKEQ